MDRLIAANSVDAGHADTAPTSGTPQFATDGDPIGGTPRTTWPAYQYNAIQEEIIGVIDAGGLTPDKTNNGQLSAAITAIINAAITAYNTLTVSPAFVAIYGGVVSAGNTLAKLYALILLRAPIDSPTFTTVANAPTPAVTDNSTKIATTGWFNSFIGAKTVVATFTGLTASTTQSIAHGLGSAPVAMYSYLKCLTANLGYAVGDQVSVPSDVTEAIWCNATLVGISISNTGISIVPKAGGGTAGITLADWSLVIVARAY